MADVVGLRGGPVRGQGEPVASVVAALEDLLERAKSGDITAFAGVVETGSVAQWHVVGSGFGFDMLGGLECAKHRLLTLMVKS